MTRPQIIRADTLDLQDTESPTAQDHTRQPAHPSPLGIGPAAPHQAAALHHVQEERASEEEQLTQAWNDTAQDEPPTADEEEERDATNGDGQYQQRDEQAVLQNGGYAGQGEDQEMADAESDDNLDEDMMDKISSSPSIDDGGYILHSPAPSTRARRARRSLQHQQQFSPRSSSLRQQTPSPVPSRGSSPFYSTPQHFPFSLLHHRSVSLETADSGGSSPFTSPPEHYPLFMQPQFHHNPSQSHHQYSEYMENNDDCMVRVVDVDEGYDDQNEESRDGLAPLWSEQLLLPRPLERDTSVSSLGEEAISRLLLPADDPLLSADVIEPHDPCNGVHALSHDFPADDGDGWETTSETSSFNSDDYKDDDTDGFPSISLITKPKDGDFDRFVDSGWGGECLREVEDIDFEFVYALHTFVATVEGQANATKGDTMVLLDDSNSYWWLVRIVKDSSIGYLPAEHIETPTERLARLNKHRNIDLSATMLGDTAEKTKNPLKKAMRRRNARTVQFNPQPTYRDASDYEYSSDEEDGEEQGLMNGGEVQAAEQSAVTETADDDTTLAETHTNATKREIEETNGNVEMNGRVDEVESRRGPAEQPRPSEESLVDKQLGPGKSRLGTVRNTDSFFRDETAETRKITLTPNILRDDSSSGNTLRTSESRERGSSLDSIDKSPVKSESSKEDRKRKEKKPGMFSGLFKKKDKKLRGIDGEMEPEKMSGEFSPTMKEDGSPMSPSTEGFPANALQPQRTGSRGKLQKANPKGENLSPNTLQPNEQFGPQKQPSPQNGSAAEPVSVNGVGPQSTMRIVQSDEDMQSEKPQSFRTKPQDQSQAEKPQSLRIKTQDQGQAEQRGKLSEITNMLRPGSNDGLPKREKVKKAKRRVELDDFDSSPDELDKPGDPFADNNADLRTGSRQGQDRSPNQAVLQEPAERLSESPVQVSPVGATRSLDTDDSNQTAATLADDSSAEDRGASPPSDNDFEHVGADAKHMPSQAQLQPQSNSRTGAFSPVSPTNPAAPAPLQITKQPGPQLRQQQQERTSPSGDSPGSSIPPQPTRMAPIPGKAPIPGAFPITPTPSTNEIPQLRQPLSLNNLSGSRSNTPTLTPSKQISAPALNTAFNAQQPPPLSTSPTSSGSSATPTATTPKTPPSHPAQPMTQDAVSRTPSHSSSLPAWSDAALRAYMDDTSHVKNLLLVVKDTSGLVPLGPDDEVVKAMWREQREGLKRLERGLDGLLEGWIERKKGGRGGGSKLGVRM